MIWFPRSSGSRGFSLTHRAFEYPTRRATSGAYVMNPRLSRKKRDRRRHRDDTSVTSLLLVSNFPSGPWYQRRSHSSAGGFDSPTFGLGREMSDSQTLLVALHVATGVHSTRRAHSATLWWEWSVTH